MYYLSGYNSDGSPQCKSLFPNCAWDESAGCAPPARMCVRCVAGPNGDSPPDLSTAWQLIPVSSPGFSFAEYQAGMQNAINGWHETWTQAVVYNGTTYTLNANPDSQTLFDKMKLALAQLSDQTEQFQLYQATGESATLAASDIVNILNAYGTAVLRREVQGAASFNSLYFAILTAQANTDLDAITLE